MGCYAGAVTLLAWKLLGYPGGLNAWPYLFLTYLITSYTCTIGVDIVGSSFGIDGSKNLAFLGALIGIPIGFSYTEFIFGEDAKRWWWLIVPLVTGHFSALGYNLHVKLKSSGRSISINLLPDRISLTFSG